MLLLDETRTRDLLSWPALIDALSTMFRGGCVMPVRHHHTVAVPGADPATLLLMPAWVPGRYAGVKIVAVFPSNGARGLPAVQGNYMLMSGETGVPLAMVDGGELTARRTAAASALAASRLAREDAETLTVIGAGRLSANLVAAHATVRPIRRATIWARDPSKARGAAAALAVEGVDITVADDLERAVRDADIVSAATLSTTPLVRGAWLKPGAHVDLVGAFRPDMRESDDASVRRASLFVDTRDGALSEGGDLVQPIREGVISEADIRADLFDLMQGRHPGRTDAEEITLFKSVGAALEDLAGAILAYERARDT
ncbi:ornithine cyclodeaminase family protein [Ensifer soli]|uniref:ornithine cyclodeaminase family protein n=1 Tax=Ciceribacter sp. sgz301302 TaxID=3342379 RepID=UPI0035B74B85